MARGPGEDADVSFSRRCHQDECGYNPFFSLEETFHFKGANKQTQIIF